MITGISINWCKFHGRSEILARKLNISDFYIYPKHKLIIWRYALSSIASIRLILTLKPKYVIVMQPPVFAMLPIYILSKFTHLRLIGDLHTGVFVDPKWRWSKRIVFRILKGKNCAIVTNNSLAVELRSKGVSNIFILDDLIEVFEIPSENGLKIEHAKPKKSLSYILVPLSYSFDEPLDILFRAIDESKNVTWILTGDASEKIRKSAPANARFIGYVSKSDYKKLVVKASGIIALTTQENTMQRAGYEALCAAVPLVISDKKVLREYFGESALYVDNTSAAIKKKVEILLNNELKYKRLMEIKRTEKMKSQEISLDLLKNFLLISD